MLTQTPTNKVQPPSYQSNSMMSIDSAQSADGGQSLGINTDFAFNGCENSGEPATDNKRREAIKLRYDLQESAQYLGKNEQWGKRLRACMVIRVDNFRENLPDEIPDDIVVVERDDETGKARYKNLVHCDSPWTCPVCALRIAEADKLEVNRAYLAARAKGWVCVMVTYTQRHDRATGLEHLLEVNASARRQMKSGTRIDGEAWSDIKDRFGLVGGIINLEVTHGENAWHPHNHELIFLNPEKAQSDDMGELRWILSKRWQASVKKFGGDCDLVHGLHLRTGDDAVAEYIAKIGHEPKNGWSIEAELTKRNAKIAKKDGRTAFQLLADYRFKNDLQAGALFSEFARHFSGKAHIRWSQGLRQLLDMDNFVLPVTESEQAKKDTRKPNFKPFLALPYVAWKKVVLSQYGRRGAFLIACEDGEVEASELLARWGYTGGVYWLEDAVNAKSALLKWLDDYNLNHPVNAKSALPKQLKMTGL